MMNLEKILKDDERIWDEDILDYPQLFELARTYDKDLLEALFNNKDSKKKFFIQVGDSHVFKYNQFRFYLEENQVNNSFTQYANKIGLSSQGEHLSDSTDYVLDWPYKDCVLEGGMSSEEDMDTFIEKKVETTPGKVDKKTGTVISTEKTEVTFSQAKRKREEIFYNNIIADKEIDRLLDKKALKNFTRYTAKGEEEVKEIKRDEDGTIKENLLIKGNNLLALHSLKEQFAGKVKLIYIDPPYNTGEDFQYNDRFNHSTWLTFMKNRLEIAKEFLREDGVILVHIDDNEQASLKYLMDEIFGRENFVETFIWNNTDNPPSLSKKSRRRVEYLYCYEKNKDTSTAYKGIQSKNEDAPLLNTGNPVKELFFQEGLIKFNIPDGKYSPFKNSKIELLDSLTIKEGVNQNKIRLKGEFKWTQETVNEEVQNGTHFLIKSEKFSIRYQRLSGSYLAPEKYFDNIYLNKSIGVGSNEDSNSHLKKMGIHFSTPTKPESIIHYFINAVTEKKDIVMDFFLGSGSTQAACIKSNRQSIGIEQLDYIKTTTIFRLNEVIKGEDGGISKEVDWKGGGDFIYFELAEYNEEAKNKIDACTSFKELKKLFTELTEYYFLNYNVSVKQFNDQLLDDKDFQELPLEEQKTLFKALLDNNQLYIPYKEQEDGKYNLSKEDQELTNEFYG
jgi:adenine-specific DNA-methyltransferase